MRDLPAGTQVGPYRIREVAGRGAVGVVYRAVHEMVGQAVAIKTLSPAYAGESVFRERFSREAETSSTVQHPNIISVFDAGEHEGLPYIVMAYVAGPDLERVLIDRGGRLTPAEAILICSLIADALDAAGAKGLAHRDVKPANILLEGWEPQRYGGERQRPHVYLTDFGLTKSSAQATVTKTGQFVGTLLYLSPEQIQAKAIPASDQYSLACVLWECLTGTYPFVPEGASPLSLLSAHLSDPVPRISQRPGGPWPAELDDVFWRALAKRPEDRYPTCRAFLDDATRVLGLGDTAPEATPAPPLAELDQPAAAAVAAASPVTASDLPPLPIAGPVAGGPVAGGPLAGGPGRVDPTPAGLPPSIPIGRPGGLAPGSTPVDPGRGRGVAIAVAVLVVLALVVVAVVLLSSGS